MAWGKKPWEGGTRPSSRKVLEQEYEFASNNINSQYQSRKETKSTVKGFLLLAFFMIGTILFLHWIAIYFT